MLRTMTAETDWERVPPVLKARIQQRRASKTRIVREGRVDWGTVDKLLDGQPVRQQAQWRVAAYLGWEPDAFDRIRRGEVPIEADPSPTGPATSDLTVLLGVGGQVVRDELDEIKARLDLLESGRAVTDTEPANVAPIAPRAASRPAKQAEKTQARAKQPTKPPTDWVYAASRADGQPDETRPTGEPVNRPAAPDDGPDPTDFHD